VDTTVIANTSGLTGNGSHLTSLTSANLTGQVPIGDLTNAWYYLTNTVSASPGYLLQYTAAGFTWLNTNVFLSPSQANSAIANVIAICTNAANLLGAAPTNILPGSLPGLSTGNGSGLTNVTYHENIFGSSIWEACANGPTYFFPHGMGQSGNQSGLYKNDVPLFIDSGYLSNFVFSFTNANSGSTSNVGYGTNIGFYFYSNILGAPIVQVTGPSLTIVNPNTAAGTRGGLISDTTTMIPITASPSVPLYFAAAVSNLSSGASGSIIVSWSAQFFHTNK
jgi:hypothetical protein